MAEPNNTLMGELRNWVIGTFTPTFYEKRLSKAFGDLLVGLLKASRAGIANIGREIDRPALALDGPGLDIGRGQGDSPHLRGLQHPSAGYRPGEGGAHGAAEGGGGAAAGLGKLYDCSCVLRRRTRDSRSLGPGTKKTADGIFPGGAVGSRPLYRRQSVKAGIDFGRPSCYTPPKLLRSPS